MYNHMYINDYECIRMYTFTNIRCHSPSFIVHMFTKIKNLAWPTSSPSSVHRRCLRTRTTGRPLAKSFPGRGSPRVEAQNLTCYGRGTQKKYVVKCFSIRRDTLYLRSSVCNQPETLMLGVLVLADLDMHRKALRLQTLGVSKLQKALGDLD